MAEGLPPKPVGHGSRGNVPLDTSMFEEDRPPVTPVTPARTGQKERNNSHIPSSALRRTPSTDANGWAARDPTRSAHLSRRRQDLPLGLSARKTSVDRSRKLSTDRDDFSSLPSPFPGPLDRGVSPRNASKFPLSPRGGAGSVGSPTMFPLDGPSVTGAAKVRKPTGHSVLHSGCATWELGAPAQVTVWAEICLMPAATVVASGAPGNNAPSNGPPNRMQRQGSFGSVIQANRRGSVDKRGGSRVGLPQDSTPAKSPIGKFLVKQKPGSPAESMSVRTSQSGFGRTAFSLSTQPALGLSVFGMDLRCVEMPPSLKIGAILADKDSGESSSSTPQWLGWILKKKKQTKLVTLHDVDIGLPTSFDDLALTSRQWAYAVVSRCGELHVCAINVGKLFWLTWLQLEDRARRLRHEAKVQGLWPNLRASAEFEAEAHIRWLCHPGGDDVPDDMSCVTVTPRKVPKAGHIRKDLTFHQTPFWRFVGDTTGYKKAYISTDKFARGLKRHAISTFEHKGEHKNSNGGDSNKPTEALAIKTKKSPRPSALGVRTMRVYTTLGVAATVQEWKEKVCKFFSSEPPGPLSPQHSLSSDDAATVVECPSQEEMPALFIGKSRLDANGFSSVDKIRESVLTLMATYDAVNYAPIDRLLAHVHLHGERSGSI